MESEQVWGFNPTALLTDLQFPNDKEETLLKLSHSHRMKTINTRPFENQRTQTVLTSKTDSTSFSANEELVGWEESKKLNPEKLNPAKSKSSRIDLQSRRGVYQEMSKEERMLKTQLAKFAAALVVQSAFRGWSTRRKYMAVKYGNLSLLSLMPSELNLNSLGNLSGLVVQERMLKKYKKYCKMYERMVYVQPEYPHFAAALIQSVFRMYYTKKAWLKFKNMTQEEQRGKEGIKTRAKMARNMRVYNPLSSETNGPSLWDKAAFKIQKTWKSYNGKKIYRFYRDMISLNNRGNPSRLLKFINPQETQLIDSASGMHIKFRLGGTTFPPTIYYKIFVHNALIDMNAFSPRNYTSSKQLLPVYLFNNMTELPIRTEKDEWYQRIENNSWRPISDKLWDLMNDSDYNPYLPVKKSIKFHYSATKRRQDVILRKKQKRLEWLKKVYKLDKTDAKEVQDLDKNIQDIENELNVESLLSWTKALDFEEYCDSWTQLATSGPVDAPYVMDLIQLKEEMERPWTGKSSHITLSDLFFS